IYLAGVIPGPHKPSSATGMEPYLDLIATDFLELWGTGVHFSRTARHRGGALCLAAIVPIVCDGPAARDVSGFTSMTSQMFCTTCNQPIQKLDDLDPSAWECRDINDHRRVAEEWRRSTASERKILEKQYGVRYSALLRLPYFDPIKYTVVDSMHNLYLGLYQRHCRDVWGMDIKLEDGDGSSRGRGKIPVIPSTEEMDKGRLALAQRNEKRLRDCSRAVLYYLCEEYDVRRAGKKPSLIAGIHFHTSLRMIINRYQADGIPDQELQAIAPENYLKLESINVTRELVKQVRMAEQGWLNGKGLGGLTHPVLFCMCYLRKLKFQIRKPVKKDMSKALMGWVSDNSGDIIDPETLLDRGPISPPKPEKATKKAAATAVLGAGVLKSFEEDRRNTELPPWISLPPIRSGHSSHGKLSADQWRVLCSVSLPILLTRLWGGDEEGSRLYRMLVNFLDLVIAVEVASMLVTSKTHIHLYRKHINSYLTNLKTLYKDATIAPNHHVALHIPDFLEIFGPSQHWRGYLAERINYTLQKINTNKRFGEVEMTFMRTFCRASNLAALMEDPNVQEAAGEMYTAYRDIENEDQRGTRIYDSTSYQPVDVELKPVNLQSTSMALDDNIYTSLLQYLRATNKEARYIPHTIIGKTQSNDIILHKMAIFIGAIQKGGITYLTHRKSPGGSNALVRPTAGAPPKPARILEVFQHARKAHSGEFVKEVFLAVKYLVAVDEEHAANDPYRKFPIMGFQLWKDSLEDGVSIIQPDQIICHFAKTRVSIPKISYPCVCVLPLNRVS
ncbi:hypothetical protein DFP72DRAFT_758290, partial [Ephemerocybe angulata]